MRYSNLNHTFRRPFPFSAQILTVKMYGSSWNHSKRPLMPLNLTIGTTTLKYLEGLTGHGRHVSEHLLPFMIEFH